MKWPWDKALEAERGRYDRLLDYHLQLERSYREAISAQAATLLDVARQIAGWRTNGAPIEPSTMTRVPSVEDLASDRANDLAIERTEEGLKLKFEQQGVPYHPDQLRELAVEMVKSYRAAVAD